MMLGRCYWFARPILHPPPSRLTHVPHTKRSSAGRDFGLAAWENNPETMRVVSCAAGGERAQEGASGAGSRLRGLGVLCLLLFVVNVP